MAIHEAVASQLHLLEGMPALFPGPLSAEDEIRYLTYLEGHAGQPPSVDVRDLTIAGRHGGVPARIYTPMGGATNGRCFVWVHGGGWVVGDLDMTEADWTAREISHRTGASVVSVDYRKAEGGVHYPVPLDDVVDAICWVRDHRSDASLGAGPLSVGGASAGANLVAGAVLRLRDEQAWSPEHVALAYPLVHPTMPDSAADLGTLMASVPRVLRFLDADVAFLVENYLGGSADEADSYAMPGLADLVGFPATTIVNAEYDDLRPSGESFTAALALAGVDVRQALAAGTLHGFLTRSGSEAPTIFALDVLSEHLKGGTS